MSASLYYEESESVDRSVLEYIYTTQRQEKLLDFSTYTSVSGEVESFCLFYDRYSSWCLAIEMNLRKTECKEMGRCNSCETSMKRF